MSRPSYLEGPDQALAVARWLALHHEDLAVDHDPVLGPRVRHLGDAQIEPRCLRPEPPAAELGDCIGPPGDDPEDMDHPVWAGVVPLRLTAGEPEQDPAQIGG